MPNLFDSTNYPAVEPAKLVAGDRWAWKRSDLNGDYSNTSHTLKYSARLENDGSTEIEITASASGSDYLVEVSNTDTASYTPGIYHWQAYIIRTSDSERITIGTGKFEVKPDRDLATTDPRGHVKKVLDALEATVLGKASKDQLSYSIAGRTLQQMPVEDLIKWQSHYKHLYRQEQEAERLENGQDPLRTIHTRF